VLKILDHNPTTGQRQEMKVEIDQKSQMEEMKVEIDQKSRVEECSPQAA
jgi:hypothetical protein